MAAGKPDIELLFGVQGGGSIKEGSGEEIVKQIANIVNEINKNPLEIKFKADEKSLKDIKSQIEKIMGTVKVPVEAALSGSGGASSASKVLRDDIATLNSSLAKIETLRHSLATSMMSIGDLQKLDTKGELNDTTRKYMEDLTRMVTQLDSLKKELQTTDLTQEEFKQKLSTISLTAQSTTNNVREFTSALSDMKQQMQGAKLVTSETTSAMKQIESLRHNVASSLETLNKIRQVDPSRDVTANYQDINKITQHLADLESKVKTTGIAQKDFDTIIANVSLDAQRAGNQITEMSKSVTRLKQELKDAEIVGGSGSAFAELTKIENLRHKLAQDKTKLGAFDQDDQTVAQYAKQVEDLTKSLGDLKTGIDQGKVTNKEFEEEFDRIALEANKASHQINEYSASIKMSAEAQKQLEASNKKIEQSLANISSTRQKYGTLGLSAGHQNEIRSLNEYEQKLEDLRIKLNEGKMSQAEFNRALAEINTGVVKASMPLDKLGNSIANVGSQVSQFIKYSLGIYSVYTAFSKGTQIIKDMVNNAIELESAFADTRIVTHATTEELKQFGVTITAIANETAASIDSLVSATTTFARLGYTLDESTMLAKYTGMLEKVGNVDTKQAEDAITSILKAFPEDATVHNIEQVMDKLVKTGNAFPISVAQIAEGMTNASSALAAAGNSFDQSVALLTAANTTVQNASKASTALRTISARIRKTKTDLDDLGEVMTESQHDEMIQALTKYHVYLTDMNGEYKSTYEIMRDISEQWDNMTSMEQAALAELVSGTRQQVVFYSIIENFKEASGAMDAMADSANALSKSYDIYLGTAAAQVERLGIAWKTFSMDFVNGDLLKAIINIGIAILKAADGLQRIHMLVPTILATLITIKSLKLAKSMGTMRVAADAFTKSLMQQGVMSKGLQVEWEALTSTQKSYVMAQLQAAAATGDVGAQSAIAALEMNGFMIAEEGAAAGATALNVSIKGLMASNPVGWIMLIISGIVSAISIVSSAIKKNEEAKKSLKDIRQEMTEFVSSIQQTTKEMRDMDQKANSIIPRFAELAKGVDALGHNTGKLNDEEYAEFVDLSNQLAELFPELQVGMDSNGNAMLNLSYNASDLADELWRVVEAQQTLARSQVASQMNDAVESAVASDEAYKLEERKIEGAIQALGTLKQAFRDSKQVGELAFVNGDEQLIELIDSIRAASPEIADGIDSILAKMGRTSDASGGLLYSLLVGDGSQYAVEDEFYEEVDRLIATTQAKLASAQNDTQANKAVVGSFIKQTTTAWVQGLSQYQDAKESIQGLILSMINNIDIDNLDIKTGSQLQNYVYSNVVQPLLKMTAEAQRSVTRYLDVSGSFAGGSSTVSQMKIALDQLSTSLEKSGLSAEDAASALEALGATELAERINTVTKGIDGEKDAVEAFVNSLSSSELDAVYNILSANGGKAMGIDDLRAKLDALAASADIVGKELKEIISLEGFFTGIKKISKNVNDVVSAMKKLREGTSLTIEELANLAEQYPELLTQSNLYTDGSIAGQERLLNVILEANQKEYESTVRTKIAELEATLKSIETRSAAELYASLGWIETQATLARGDMDPNAQSAALHAAEQKMKEQIQNEISNISNFGSDFVANALKDMEAALAKNVSSSSSSSSGSSSYSSSSKNNPIADWINHAKYIMNIGANAPHFDMAQFLAELGEKIRYHIDNGDVSEEDAKQYIEELIKGIHDLENDVKKTIDNLVAYRLKMLQEVKKKEKKDLEDRLKALKDFYDKQKDMLRDQLDEDKYLEEQREKRKAVSDIQASMDQLRYDNSAWAQRRMAELSQELADARKELADFERDKATDDAIEMLDKQYEIQADSIQREIDGIEEILNDPNTLYNQALADIQSSSAEIYREIKAYGEENKNNGVNEGLKALDEAAEAIRLWEKYLDLNKDKPYNVGGKYVPGSHGANEIKWVIEDGYIIPKVGGYASGTSNAISGLHRIDERGAETIFTSSTGGKYRIFSHGDKVLDAESSSFLYKFANSRGSNIMSAMRTMANSGSFGNNIIGARDIKTGDINIYGNVDERTVSEIRRAQREGIEQLLRGLGKLR